MTNQENSSEGASAPLASNVEGAAAVPNHPAKWIEKVTEFAKCVGVPFEQASDALSTLVDADEAGLAQLGDPQLVPFDELKAALPTAKVAKLRAALAVFRPAAKPPGTEATASSPVMASASLDILPQAPDDAGWLSALKTGGVLKIGNASVVSALRAAMANKVHLYELPKTIIARMEEVALEQEEPVGEEYFKLRKLLTQRRYSEIFAVLETDVQSSFMSQKAKDALLGRLDALIWPALSGFQERLDAWVKTWQSGMSNPGLFALVLTGGLAGTGGLPPGLIQPPETATITDAAEGVVDTFNKVFAGLGVPVAAALAYDAMKIKEVLENPDLPVRLGVANREQMLKAIGANVSADYIRTERSIVRYALGIMDFVRSNVGGNQDLAYLGALWSLGSQINFNVFLGPTTRSTRRVSSPFGEDRDLRHS